MDIRTMRASSYKKEVREQYEKYPFPLRDPEEERKRLHVCALDMPAKLNHYCYAGRQSFNDEFRVLVAGGGAGDTTIYLGEALRGRNVEIVHVDISTSSIAIAKKRAHVRRLKGITWINESVLDLPSLGLGSFDYINCAGVLHHLEDPDAGLRALVSSLKDVGAMGLMVYGRYGRLDLYATQDLMRLVNKATTKLAERVANAKAVLRCLPPSNILLRGRHRQDVEAMFLADDSNIYDALLHEQDAPFTVPEVYEFVERAGLKMISFTNYRNDAGICRLEYDLHLHLGSDPELTARMRRLPKRDQEAVAEAVNGGIGLHSFYVAKDERRPVSFADPNVIPCFLTAGAETICRAIAEKPEASVTVHLRNSLDVSVSLDRISSAALRLVDGRRTMRSISDTISADFMLRGKPVDQDQVVKALTEDFELLNAFNWLVGRTDEGVFFPPIPDVAYFRATIDDGTGPPD